ncbi:MAG: transcription termination/antitermination protein NusG [Candidatus Cloacimonadales bacterium]|jgi:transcriptional antiterminator NusG|nr:transcription termination/antitermination protein NusG [Candidatus Cloacimonadota bacterium]MDD2650811.1 transcription termination/antitermination protein NusG [Candidatus Cloacimonadota bacterium]MDX9977765.1 transcription termination/antitermination protein NusG [Candidatus Cloacimonadales bacterium]
MKYYVLQTRTGDEHRVKEAIENGVRDSLLEAHLGQIIIPIQRAFHIRQGRRVERERKVFNNYIIIEAELSNELRNYITGISGVIKFLGPSGNPIPLTAEEIDRIKGVAQRDHSDAKTYNFLPGDKIKITTGPFTDFEGIVDKINQEASRLTVKVTVFGRVTSVEVNIEQVEII